MLFHRDAPGRRVRLGYCMNLHPADSVEGVLQGLAGVTVPVRRRLEERGILKPGDPFGVGMYLPAAAAAQLSRDSAQLDVLSAALEAAALDPFTFNAFPYGGFHTAGLKRDVFRPTWAEPARRDYTLDVARVAVELAVRLDVQPRATLLPISTHAGCHISHAADGSFDAEAADALLLETLQGLGRLEQETGRRVVLSVEPEPRSRANDTEEWRIRTAAFLETLGPADQSLAAVHLGLCLDACHTAVEFESPEDATSNAARCGLPLGKLQFSSAVELPNPRRNSAALQQLLQLDEPVYLHQSTAARGGAVQARAGDLSELAEDLAGPAADAWLDADLLRTHFHVPVDLARPGDPDSALGTTVHSADALLDELLAHPERWGTDELQIEIETYTWSVLPDSARGPGTLIDGLLREYDHVLERLAAGGFRAGVEPSA